MTETIKRLEIPLPASYIPLSLEQIAQSPDPLGELLRHPDIWRQWQSTYFNALSDRGAPMHKVRGEKTLIVDPRNFWGKIAGAFHGSVPGNVTQMVSHLVKTIGTSSSGQSDFVQIEVTPEMDAKARDSGSTTGTVHFSEASGSFSGQALISFDTGFFESGKIGHINLTDSASTAKARVLDMAGYILAASNELAMNPDYDCRVVVAEALQLLELEEASRLTHWYARHSGQGDYLTDTDDVSMHLKRRSEILYNRREKTAATPFGRKELHSYYDVMRRTPQGKWVVQDHPLVTDLLSVYMQRSQLLQESLQVTERQYQGKTEQVINWDSAYGLGYDTQIVPKRSREGDAFTDMFADAVAVFPQLKEQLPKHLQQIVSADIDFIEAHIHETPELCNHLMETVCRALAPLQSPGVRAEIPQIQPHPKLYAKDHNHPLHQRKEEFMAAAIERTKRKPSTASKVAERVARSLAQKGSTFRYSLPWHIIHGKGHLIGYDWELGMFRQATRENPYVEPYSLSINNYEDDQRVEENVESAVHRSREAVLFSLEAYKEYMTIKEHPGLSLVPPLSDLEAQFYATGKYTQVDIAEFQKVVEDIRIAGELVMETINAGYARDDDSDAELLKAFHHQLTLLKGTPAEQTEDYRIMKYRYEKLLISYTQYATGMGDTHKVRTYEQSSRAAGRNRYLEIARLLRECNNTGIQVPVRPRLVSHRTQQNSPYDVVAYLHGGFSSSMKDFPDDSMPYEDDGHPVFGFSDIEVYHGSVQLIPQGFIDETTEAAIANGARQGVWNKDVSNPATQSVIDNPESTLGRVTFDELDRYVVQLLRRIKAGEEPIPRITAELVTPHAQIEAEAAMKAAKEGKDTDMSRSLARMSLLQGAIREVFTAEQQQTLVTVHETLAYCERYLTEKARLVQLCQDIGTVFEARGPLMKDAFHFPLPEPLVALTQLVENPQNLTEVVQKVKAGTITSVEVLSGIDDLDTIIRNWVQANGERYTFTSPAELKPYIESLILLNNHLRYISGFIITNPISNGHFLLERDRELPEGSIPYAISGNKGYSEKKPRWMVDEEVPGQVRHADTPLCYIVNERGEVVVQMVAVGHRENTSQENSYLRPFDRIGEGDVILCFGPNAEQPHAPVWDGTTPFTELKVISTGRVSREDNFSDLEEKITIPPDVREMLERQSEHLAFKAPVEIDETVYFGYLNNELREHFSQQEAETLARKQLEEEQRKAERKAAIDAGKPGTIPPYQSRRGEAGQTFEEKDRIQRTRWADRTGLSPDDISLDRVNMTTTEDGPHITLGFSRVYPVEVRTLPEGVRLAIFRTEDGRMIYRPYQGRDAFLDKLEAFVQEEKTRHATEERQTAGAPPEEDPAYWLALESDAALIKAIEGEAGDLSLERVGESRKIVTRLIEKLKAYNKDPNREKLMNLREKLWALESILSQKEILPPGFSEGEASDTRVAALAAIVRQKAFERIAKPNRDHAMNYHITREDIFTARLTPLLETLSSNLNVQILYNDEPNKDELYSGLRERISKRILADGIIPDDETFNTLVDELL